jgi:hypothetical protein
MMVPGDGINPLQWFVFDALAGHQTSGPGCPPGLFLLPEIPLPDLNTSPAASTCGDLRKVARSALVANVTVW